MRPAAQARTSSSRIDRATAWDTEHGDDCTFADVPYHMMYFDRELVVKAIERGQDVPATEQRTQRSMADLNAWNAHFFAERPRVRGRSSRLRNGVKSAAASARCSRIVTTPSSMMRCGTLPGCGWLPAAAALGACIAHGWREFI